MQFVTWLFCACLSASPIKLSLRKNLHNVCFPIAVLERATSEGCAWKCILGMRPHAPIYFFCCVIHVFRVMKVAFMLFHMNNKLPVVEAQIQIRVIRPYFLPEPAKNMKSDAILLLTDSNTGRSGTVLIAICKMMLELCSWYFVHLMRVRTQF